MKRIGDWLGSWVDTLLTVVMFLLLIDFVALLILPLVWGGYMIIHEMIK